MNVVPARPWCLSVTKTPVTFSQSKQKEIIPWGGDSLGEGTSMLEPEIVKNRGLSRVSDGKVRDDVNM